MCNNPLLSSNSACLPAAGAGYTMPVGGPPSTVAVESSLIDAILSSLTSSGGGEDGGVELDETTGEGEREGGDGLGVGDVDSSEE